MTPAFLFFSLGTVEMVVIAIVGLLLFGRRLPEVGRSLGKSFVEFKAGLNDMQSQLKEVDRLTDEQAASGSQDDAPRDDELRDVEATTEESTREPDAEKA